MFWHGIVAVLLPATQTHIKSSTHKHKVKGNIEHENEKKKVKERLGMER